MNRNKSNLMKKADLVHKGIEYMKAVEHNLYDSKQNTAN